MAGAARGTPGAGAVAQAWREARARGPGDRNATLAYQTRFGGGTTANYEALETLRSVLHLPALPRRIECFDISTIQGAETVASMVVCEDGRMRRNEYRKFRVRADG